MVPVIFVCGIAYYQRHYGLTAVGLHAVFRAVVVSRLIYAAPAWSGRQIANVQMHSCIAASDAVSARPTCRNFTNCWRSVTMSCLIKLWTIHIIHFTRCFRQNPWQRNVINLDNVLMIDSCQHIMDTCLTVILLHDYCTQTYINLHKLFTLHCNFICVLSVVIIKTDDDDDDDDDLMFFNCCLIFIHLF